MINVGVIIVVTDTPKPLMCVVNCGIKNRCSYSSRSKI